MICDCLGHGRSHRNTAQNKSRIMDMVEDGLQQYPNGGRKTLNNHEAGPPVGPTMWST